MNETIFNEISEHYQLVGACLEDAELMDTIDQVAQETIKRLNAGGKIITFGNGGSAADAMHFVGEMVGRFRREREAFRAICLNTDPVVMTAVGNDYGFDEIFMRQAWALMDPEKDIMYAYSTGGTSENILMALPSRGWINVPIVAFTGPNRTPHSLWGLAEYRISIPIPNTEIGRAHV